MTLREEHLKYIKKKDFQIKCSTEIFSADEINILRVYGYWFQALTTGTIAAFTEEQKRFIEVHQNKLKPTNEYEKTWLKYQERLKIEKSDPDISKRNYEWRDKSEEWFSRGDRGKMMPYGGSRKGK